MAMLVAISVGVRADTVAPDRLSRDEAATAVVDGGCLPFAIAERETDPGFAFPVTGVLCRRGQLGDAAYEFTGSEYRLVRIKTSAGEATETSATATEEVQSAPPSATDIVVAAEPDSPLVAKLRAIAAVLWDSRFVLVPMCLATAALGSAVSLGRTVARNAAHRRECALKERLSQEQLRAEKDAVFHAERNRAEHERCVFEAAQQHAREERERMARAVSLEGAMDTLEAQIASLIKELLPSPAAEPEATICPCPGCGARCRVRGHLAPDARISCPRCKTIFSLGGSHAAAV
jgi:hypothetical protein